jgi:hypothetical protein
MADVHRLFGATFSDRQLKLVTEAYDKAWSEISGNFDQNTAPSARDRLAKMMLQVAPLATDADALAAEVVQSYRKQWGSSMERER